MFINNFDPVAFEVFSLEIRWYSLAYIFGIVLGWIYCKKKLIKDPIVLDLFDDFITYLIIGIILGGRIGYALFYNFSYYINNPLEILMVWNGGMSFHGGLIGVILSCVIFGKKYKINSFIFLDLVALSAPIGIFFGRIANFINSELYGRATDLPWGVQFVLIDNIKRHPSQIYEAFFEGIILFFILNYLFRRKYIVTPGKLSALFLIFYSLFRYSLEFFRVPDPQIGFLFLNSTLGQIISLLFFVIGVLLFYLKKNEN
jgi:phosphatidylglycerol:prolipoprotein diacylglycerol transferase|tara:strand:- start:5047 stop:5820 length:774 start_codon:yes stop_codon:yes gene_type:complete